MERVPLPPRKPALELATPRAPELLSKKALAFFLGVSPWTVDRWRQVDPGFPAPLWMSDTSPRWWRSEIEQWLASRPRGDLAPAWRNSVTGRSRTSGRR
jgi:predicted DNA-binding transcriptional regulator AlpA